MYMTQALKITQIHFNNVNTLLLLGYKFQNSLTNYKIPFKKTNYSELSALMHCLIMHAFH